VTAEQQEQQLQQHKQHSTGEPSCRQFRVNTTANTSMAQHLAGVTATVLAAPADGVAPALLLSISDSSSKGRTLGQYLINAPEGVSRLMLEHKCRPGLHFKALFLSGCSAAEAGGLGGLLLRLKQDGHGAMQLVGPAGVLSYVIVVISPLVVKLQFNMLSSNMQHNIMPACCFLQDCLLLEPPAAVCYTHRHQSHNVTDVT
jgi:hypothetical protein